MSQYPDRADVLTWCRPSDAPTGLWDRIDGLGWLPPSERVVLQVGQRAASSLVIETARALIDFLRQQQPQARIEVIDADGLDGDWAALGATRIDPGQAVQVNAIAVPEVSVPRLWFESFTLITITSCAPCPRLLMASALDAQAELLRRLDNRHDDATLAYEAHRLAASDVVVVCGTARRGEHGSDRWWAASRSDSAVEAVVGRAAGAGTLPLLRMLARHEHLPEPSGLGEPLPRLEGYCAPLWQVRATAARQGVAQSVRGAIRDAFIVRRNLGKIPGFVRRKLASRSGSAA